MLKFEPVDFMTVTVDDEKHTITRNELMKNEALANSIELYERLFKDVEDVEYERIKILLAFNTQKNSLMHQVDQYAKLISGRLRRRICEDPSSLLLVTSELYMNPRGTPHF